MSRVLTLSNGQVIALDNIDISIPEPFRDMFGRLRVSSPLTQVQIKQSDNVVRSQTMVAGSLVTGIATVATNGYTTLISNGTTGKYRLKSKICGLYQNGKSLLIFFSFNFTATTVPSGVFKRAGYFEGLDGSNNTNGIYLAQDSTGVSWNLHSRVTGNRKVLQNNWTNPRLNEIDWSKSQIGWIAIEYLGVGDVACGFVQDREIKLCHIFSHKNSLDNVYLPSPNAPICYEMEVNRSESSPQGFTTICGAVLVEAGQEKTGIPFSQFSTNLLTLPANSSRAVLLFRNTNINQRVLINSFETAVGTSATIVSALCKVSNVTNLPVSVVENGVEFWSPINTNVTFEIEETLLSTLTTNATRQTNVAFNVNTYLESDFINNGDIYAIIVRSDTNSTSFRAAIVNLILEI